MCNQNHTLQRFTSISSYSSLCLLFPSALAIYYHSDDICSWILCTVFISHNIFSMELRCQCIYSPKTTVYLLFLYYTLLYRAMIRVRQLWKKFECFFFAIPLRSLSWAQNHKHFNYYICEAITMKEEHSITNTMNVAEGKFFAGSLENIYFFHPPLCLCVYKRKSIRKFIQSRSRMLS